MITVDGRLEAERKQRPSTGPLRGPLPPGSALAAVARCVASTGLLLAQGRVHLPRDHVDRQLRFADGTRGRVYRETSVDRPPPADPCVLVVRFRLRGLRGRGHAVFRWESLLNVPLFAGFPGFVSKLWLAHDSRGRYRGLYEWDGPRDAEAYARALWRVLALVSVKGSIDYRLVDGVRRDDLLADPQRLVPADPAEEGAWWRLVDPV